MDEMYVPEQKLNEERACLLFPKRPAIGNEALALEVLTAAQQSNEKTRYAAALKLQRALQAYLNELGIGPPYSVYYEGGNTIRLVVLPGMQVGHRIYIFMHRENQPLGLAEIWYSYARCFSPIDSRGLASLYIPVGDTEVWRRKTLEIMVCRSAPRDDYFFPSTAF